MHMTLGGWIRGVGLFINPQAFCACPDIQGQDVRLPDRKALTARYPHLTDGSRRPVAVFGDPPLGRALPSRPERMGCARCRLPLPLQLPVRAERPWISGYNRDKIGPVETRPSVVATSWL